MKFHSPSILKICTRIASIALLATSFAASAQVWKPISGVDAPGYGGMIRGMATSPDGKFWASIEGGGLYVSSDAGASYTSRNVGITDLRVWSALIDSTGYNSTTVGSTYKLYVSSMGGGVYVSTDSGATFTAKNNGLTCTYVRNTRRVGTRLLAATDCGAFSGIYYSDDGANTWTLSTGIPTDATVSSTTATYTTSSTVPDYLLANTEAGIYKSTNSGTSWVALPSSPTGPLGQNVYGVTPLYDANATDKLVLLATVPGAGVFRSTDQGATWTASNSGLPTSSVLAPMSSVNVETGINVSIALDGLGIYKSTDRGATWSLFADNTKLPGARFYFLSSAGSSAAKMHVGTTAGSYVSSDNGTTWVKATGLPGGTTSNVGFDSNGVTYASTASGTYKLDSGSKVWARLAGLPATDSSSVTIKGTQVYSGTNNFGVYKLSGTQWVPMNTGLPSAEKLVSGNANLRNDSSSSTGLYVGFYGAGFFYYDGTTWVARNTGLSDNAKKIRFVATYGQNVFIITEDGTYRSTDGGLNWVAKGPKLSTQTTQLRGDRITFDPYNPGVVYATIYNTDASNVSKEGNGLWKSTDNGDTWASVSNPIFNGKKVHDVRVFSTGNGYITTAAVWDTDGSGGLFGTQDNGATWQTIGGGLNTVLVNGVFASPINNTGGYVATRGAGLFSYSSTNDGLDDDRYFGTYTGTDGALNYSLYYGLYDSPKTYSSMTLSNGSISSQATYDATNGKWNVNLFFGTTAPSSSAVYTVYMNGASGGTKTVSFSIGTRGWNTQPVSNILPNTMSSVTQAPTITWSAPSNSVQNTTYQVEVRTNDASNNTLWSTKTSLGAVNAVTYGGPSLTANTNYQVNVTAQTPDLFAGVGYGATRAQVFCYLCSSTTNGNTSTTNGGGTTTTGGVTSTTQTGAFGGGVALAKGWNLMGNGTNTPFAVGTLFNNSSLVTSIWKWLADKGAWAFYTPSLNATELAAYANTKGFDVLTTINPGDGFWVNTPTASTFTHPQGSTLTAFQTSNFAAGGSKALPSSWSLIAIGDNKTVSAFNNDIIPQEFPPSPGKVSENLTSLWAWDAAQSGWYFYAPSLYNKGTLSSYITGKQYLEFGSGAKLTPSMGFWVNLP